ncbi:MAG: hypothetical protein H0X62_15980 [Bacteroidetes bacterium]|nr:hypothetical protein [Bacteroidota bacterium]
MKKLTLLFAFAVICSLSSFAQTKQVKLSLDELVILSDYIKVLEKRDSLNLKLINNYEQELMKLKTENAVLKEESKVTAPVIDDRKKQEIKFASFQEAVTENKFAISAELVK